MAVPRTQYVTSGDVQLAYQVFGEGEREIVLVFDWCSNLEILWEQPLVLEFLEALGRLGRVLWFDMRGIGLSDPVPGGGLGAPEDWVGDIEAVMDAAGFERPCIFAQGQPVQLALMAATTRPERVSSLVLYNGFACLARHDDYPAGLPPSAQEASLELIRTQWGKGTLTGILCPSVVDRPGVIEWWGRVERFAATPRMAVTRSRTVYELDLRHVLPLVSVPTLVVHSRDNGFVRVGHGRYLAEHIPDVRLVELDTADHWPVGSELQGAVQEFLTGERLVVDDSDRVLATVLVVDVVGSTEHASTLGDGRWSALRDRFEAVVRDSLAAYGGAFVNSAGDGVLATFEGPARAIRCAAQVRDAVRVQGLEVRSGLHAGEIVRRNDDISGIAVHIGARVGAAAAPGEVLVTRTVRDLVAGSGIVFEERGEHELKGVPDTWALYAAV